VEQNLKMPSTIFHPSADSSHRTQRHIVRSSMRQRAVARTIGVAIVSVIVVGVLLYQFLGTDIGSPDESRRIRHPAGFSIVEPRGFEHTLRIETQNAVGVSSDPSISMTPIKSEGRPGVFMVSRLKQFPTDSERAKLKLLPGNFAGQPAWEAIDMDKNRQRKWTRMCVFEREGKAYQIYLERPATEPITGSTWTAYIESFRVEKPLILQALIKAPSTQPSP